MTEVREMSLPPPCLLRKLFEDLGEVRRCEEI